MPPFIPDIGTPTDTNEPYSNVSFAISLLKILLIRYIKWLDFVLKQDVLPLTISTSYGDDEQTGSSLLDFM